MIIGIDGKMLHLSELDFIERQLFGIVSPEDFYKSLTTYLKNSPKIDLVSKSYLTLEETKIVDKFIQNYFSHLIDDARIYIVRAYLIGKLLADTDKAGTVFSLGLEKLNQLPSFIRDAVEHYHLTIEEATAMNSAVERGAMFMTNTITNTQQQVKSALIESVMRGEGASGVEKRLREMLMNEGGELNRDWKRVAISETNNAFANGYLSVMEDGEFVLGIEMPDACPHCLEMNNMKVFKVLKDAPPDYSEIKNTDEYDRIADIWEVCVWEGKNNFGRSTSPRKRIDKTKGNKEENLIGREHHELSVPVIPLHPNCRGRWVAFNVNMQYIGKDANGNETIRLKVENPEEYQRWYEDNIQGYGD